MLDRPTKRICPSVIDNTRLNTWRQAAGLMKGISPSITSISASAPSSLSTGCACYLRGAAEPAGAPDPRMALKKSLLESITITSDLLRKLLR